MSNDTARVGREPGLGHAFRTMPKWKVLLLVGSLVVGVLGVGAEVASKNLHKQQPQVVVTQTAAAPARTGDPSIAAGQPGASGFVSGDPTPTPDQSPPQTTTTTTTTVPAQSTITDWISPKVAAIGFSLFIGVVVGVVTRAFLKLATLLAALVVAAIAAAHYFNINLDLSAVQTEAGHATTWMGGQLSQFKDFIFAHLPSAGSATAGFLFGMKRR